MFLVIDPPNSGIGVAGDFLSPVSCGIVKVERILRKPNISAHVIAEQVVTLLFPFKSLNFNTENGKLSNWNYHSIQQYNLLYSIIYLYCHLFIHWRSSKEILRPYLFIPAANYAKLLL